MDYLEIATLYHYGVKGMKWGVRHENEDYPMSERPSHKQPMSEEPRFNADKIGIINRAKKNVSKSVEKTNKAMANFDRRIESKFFKQTKQKDLTNNMDNIPESTRTKRGYAIAGALLATIGVGVAINTISKKKTTKTGEIATKEILERAIDSASK